MVLNKDMGLKVAEFLLQIKAIVLKPKDPFLWASGWYSPIYCDNRKTLSYPKIRTFLRQELSKTIREHYGKPDVIAGVATGGIPQGVLVAQDLELPFIYVRSTPKGHGMANLVEGEANEGDQVVLVEDLISTGGSSLKAMEALREKKLKVKGMLSIFDYGFQISKDNFEAAKCELISLCDYSILIEQALKTGYITEKMLDSLEKWRSNPSGWKP